MVSKYNFKARGIGIISTSNIPINTHIGNYFTKSEPITTESRFIYDGWIETNPFGRYLNHNRNPNCNLVLNDDCIEIYSNYNILPSVELTVNYIEAIQLIKLPIYLQDKYKILDLDYISEEIVIKKVLL
jgi:hypothetical protein